MSTWTIDAAHSSVHFSIRHLMFAKVRGRFSRFSGTVTGADGDLSAASVVATLEADSIDTGIADRDNHLRSADFFDVASYPTLRFASTRVEAAGEGLRVHGDLTIRDVSLPVVLEAEHTGFATDPWGGQRVGFTAKTSLSRAAFGLKWNQALEAGGVLVGDKVEIELDIQAVKSA